MNGLSLTLEAAECQGDAAPMTGLQIAYELWLRNPDDVDVTGYQAFLEFDDSAMAYEGGLSDYTSSPFAAHIQPNATADVATGERRLDGNDAIGTDGDALLATLYFTVTECDTNTIAFDLTQAFDSEASFMGSPLATALLDSDGVTAYGIAPVLSGVPADITQPADAGSCTEAVVSWTGPSATDNCDPGPVVACTPPSGSTFPVGTTVVTCTATDVCGNVSESTFNVTVTATNAVDVVVNLTGSIPTNRCIRFGVDPCGTVASSDLNFVGSNPAVATVTIEVPCGVWTTVCAKDQQHTKWANTTLTQVGAKHVADTTLVLDGSDTDDDGDVDINDVTLLLAQFGDLDSPGGCPWDGVTRDADFDNDGAIGGLDYSFLAST